jgi:hypothetical protein
VGGKPPIRLSKLLKSQGDSHNRSDSGKIELKVEGCGLVRPASLPLWDKKLWLATTNQP